MLVDLRGKQVQELDFSGHDPATATAKEAQALTTVQTLLVSDNCVARLKALHAFTMLRDIDLSNNALTAIDAAELPPTLELLVVRGNHLTAVDFALKLPRLHRLDVSHNKLRQLFSFSDLGSAVRTKAGGGAASALASADTSFARVTPNTSLQVIDVREAANLSHTSPQRTKRPKSKTQGHDDASLLAGGAAPQNNDPTFVSVLQELVATDNPLRSIDGAEALTSLVRLDVSRCDLRVPTDFLLSAELCAMRGRSASSGAAVTVLPDPGDGQLNAAPLEAGRLLRCLESMSVQGTPAVTDDAGFVEDELLRQIPTLHTIDGLQRRLPLGSVSAAASAVASVAASEAGRSRSRPASSRGASPDRPAPRGARHVVDSFDEDAVSETSVDLSPPSTKKPRGRHRGGPEYRGQEIRDRKSWMDRPTVDDEHSPFDAAAPGRPSSGTVAPHSPPRMNALEERTSLEARVLTTMDRDVPSHQDSRTAVDVRSTATSPGHPAGDASTPGQGSRGTHQHVSSSGDVSPVSPAAVSLAAATQLGLSAVDASMVRRSVPRIVDDSQHAATTGDTTARFAHHQHHHSDVGLVYGNSRDQNGDGDHDACDDETIDGRLEDDVSNDGDAYAATDVPGLERSNDADAADDDEIHIYDSDEEGEIPAEDQARFDEFEAYLATLAREVAMAKERSARLRDEVAAAEDAVATERQCVAAQGDEIKSLRAAQQAAQKAVATERIKAGKAAVEVEYSKTSRVYKQQRPVRQMRAEEATRIQRAEEHRRMQRVAAASAKRGAVVREQEEAQRLATENAPLGSEFSKHYGAHADHRDGDLVDATGRHLSPGRSAAAALSNQRHVSPRHRSDPLAPAKFMYQAPASLATRPKVNRHANPNTMHGPLGQSSLHGSPLGTAWTRGHGHGGRSELTAGGASDPDLSRINTTNEGAPSAALSAFYSQQASRRDGDTGTSPSSGGGGSTPRNGRRHTGPTPSFSTADHPGRVGHQGQQGGQQGGQGQRGQKRTVGGDSIGYESPRLRSGRAVDVEVSSPAFAVASRHGGSTRVVSDAPVPATATELFASKPPASTSTKPDREMLLSRAPRPSVGGFVVDGSCACPAPVPLMASKSAQRELKKTRGEQAVAPLSNQGRHATSSPPLQQTAAPHHQHLHDGPVAKGNSQAVAHLRADSGEVASAPAPASRVTASSLTLPTAVPTVTLSHQSHEAVRVHMYSDQAETMTHSREIVGAGAVGVGPGAQVDRRVSATGLAGGAVVKTADELQDQSPDTTRDSVGSAVPAFDIPSRASSFKDDIVPLPL